MFYTWVSGQTRGFVSETEQRERRSWLNNRQRLHTTQIQQPSPSALHTLQKTRVYTHTLAAVTCTIFVRCLACLQLLKYSNNSTLQCTADTLTCVQTNERTHTYERGEAKPWRRELGVCKHRTRPVYFTTHKERTRNLPLSHSRLGYLWRSPVCGAMAWRGVSPVWTSRDRRDEAVSGQHINWTTTDDLSSQPARACVSTERSRALNPSHSRLASRRNAL